MTKVALVTGAAAGIGRACAVRFGREGKAVGVLDVNAEGAEAVAAEIRAAGGKAISVGCDISQRAQVVAAVDKIRQALGPITILVNNAAITRFAKFEELTDELWDHLYGINVRGTFIVTQVVVPDMKAAKWGRIINMSSSSIYAASEIAVLYASSKSAIIAFTRSLAGALGVHGVTVNCIPPGSVKDTAMYDENKGVINEEQLARTLPAKRVGTPDDLAAAVSFLASEEAGYITGQTLPVNGGRAMV